MKKLSNRSWTCDSWRASVDRGFVMRSSFVYDYLIVYYISAVSLYKCIYCGYFEIPVSYHPFRAIRGEQDAHCTVHAAPFLMLLLIIIIIISISISISIIIILFLAATKINILEKKHMLFHKIWYASPHCASGWKPCNRNWPIGPSPGLFIVRHVHNRLLPLILMITMMMNMKINHDFMISPLSLDHSDIFSTCSFKASHASLLSMCNAVNTCRQPHWGSVSPALRRETQSENSEFTSVIKWNHWYPFNLYFRLF